MFRKIFWLLFVGYRSSSLDVLCTQHLRDQTFIWPSSTRLLTLLCHYFSDAFGITLHQRFLTTLFDCCIRVQISFIFTHLELLFYLNLLLGQKRGQSNKINSWSVRKVQSTTTREWKTYYWTWKNFRSNKCSSTSSIRQRWFCSHWKTPSWKWAIDYRTRENAEISQYWLVY